MAVYNDFLSLSMAMVRRSIRGIDDSYSNYWDILAELLQNSVDAIKKGNYIPVVHKNDVTSWEIAEKVWTFVKENPKFQV